jgi:hypothetical protein
MGEYSTATMIVATKLRLPRHSAFRRYKFFHNPATQTVAYLFYITKKEEDMDRYAIHITMVIFFGFLVLFAMNGGQNGIHPQAKEQVAIETLTR